VRVLIDEQMPDQLTVELTGHEVRSVGQMGWKGLAASGHRNFEVAAYLTHEILLHLTMTRNGRHFARRRVHVNGMAATFAKKAAAKRLEMANQVDALHPAR